VAAAKLTHADYQTLAEFRYQLRRFLGFSERACRAAGLEPQQHQLLLAIKGMPEDTRPNVGALAERLQLRHHSAVELIDRMEERRLVRRARDPDDGRQVLVQLTTRGETSLGRLAAAHRGALRSLAPALRAALSGMLARHRAAT
jgi:DNA-binding MarR family transcriptional regulator